MLRNKNETVQENTSSIGNALNIMFSKAKMNDKTDCLKTTHFYLLNSC